VDDVVAFIISLDGARALLPASPRTRSALAVDAMREALTPYASLDGVVMDATAWLVVAHR